MGTYFAENLEGTGISGLVRSYGNRYYKKRIVVGELRRRGPISVDWFRFAQARTRKAVKGMITGPYTMMDWAFDEHYGSREALAMAFAKALHEEARDLEAAGAKVIQVDEPALATRQDELPIGVIDVHSHVVETEEAVRMRIEKALSIFHPQKLWISPDCGLKTRSVEEAQGKMRAMVAATQAVKKAHGILQAP